MKHIKHIHQDVLHGSFANESDLFAILKKSFRPFPPGTVTQLKPLPDEFLCSRSSSDVVTPRVKPRLVIYTKNLRPIKPLPQRANSNRAVTASSAAKPSPGTRRQKQKEKQKQEESEGEETFNDIPDRSSDVDEGEQLMEMIVQQVVESDTLLISRPPLYNRVNTEPEPIFVHTGIKGLEIKYSSS